MPSSTFGIRRKPAAKGSADLRNRPRTHSVPTTDPASLSHGPRTSLIDAEWGTTNSQPDSVPVESAVRRSPLAAVSHGPRTSLIDAEWGTTNSQPDSMVLQPFLGVIPVESAVRRNPLAAVSHGPRTSLIDAEWGTTDSLPSNPQRNSIQAKSKIRPRASKALSHEPRTPRIDAGRVMTDSQICLQRETVPFELTRPFTQGSAQEQVLPRLVAPRRNTGWLLWLASSIIVLSGLGFGFSRIDANYITGRVTHGVPPAPPSVPVVMPKPPAPIALSTPAAVPTPASQAIPVPVETFAEPLVLSAKANPKTVNRRPAVPRKVQAMAQTSHQLPSVVAFDVL